MEEKQLEAMKLAMTLYFMKDAPDNVLMADFRRIYEAGYRAGIEKGASPNLPPEPLSLNEVGLLWWILNERQIDVDKQGEIEPSDPSNVFRLRLLDKLIKWKALLLERETGGG